MVHLDQATLELFERTLRNALAGPGDRTTALEECGWRDVLAVDPAAAVPLVFRLQGELRARSAALDDIAFHALGSGSDGPPAMAQHGAFVHPNPARAVAGSMRGSQLAVDGLMLQTPGALVTLLATVGDDTHSVSVPTDQLALTSVTGMDPTLRLTRVVGAVPSAACEVGEQGTATSVAIVCRRALAFELVGLGNTMLAMTSEYAGAWVQFGQPIGTFQAVKHRLADVYVALRAAEVAAAESAAQHDTVDAEITAMAAKCLAGRGFRLAAENCLQVMGAIGFTLEHELHHFITRGTVLDVLYGSAHRLRVELGQHLQARGAMPRPAVL